MTRCRYIDDGGEGVIPAEENCSLEDLAYEAWLCSCARLANSSRCVSSRKNACGVCIGASQGKRCEANAQEPRSISEHQVASGQFSFNDRPDD